MTTSYKTAWLIVITFYFAAVTASADTARGVAKVSSIPSGATVYIKGREYGPTPVLIELEAGKYPAVVTLDGYPPEKRILAVSAGRTTATRVAFANALPKNGIRVHNMEIGGKDAGPGTVMVTTEPPQLTVYMNDTKVPQPTPVAFDIQAGIYNLRIEQRGVSMLNKTVFVRAGRTIELSFQVKHRREIDINDPWR